MNAMVPAGNRNRRLAIQSRSASKGTYGEQAATWSTLGTYWAEIRGMSGRELTNAQQLNAEVTHRIAVPYHDALADPVALAKCRAVYGSRIFNIRAAINTSERNREIVLFCTEGVNDG